MESSFKNFWSKIERHLCRRHVVARSWTPHRNVAGHSDITPTDRYLLEQHELRRLLLEAFSAGMDHRQAVNAYFRSVLDGEGAEADSDAELAAGHGLKIQ